ncbi:hypothetical protein PTTG_07959 [Puccinia triticina 1-1 BBBD Race 1]|uniref:Uncharacterized protein n=1 Tax=Puccinia triticina (isolate 1-1 / race 1 (BBBD)) TaxID=630390 RepID=A0A0C4F4B9_PUCT1|nr:hypothetical protein PTTG_07959 [Puccinia triticina 1-1 BBBD Race 1]WAR57240.1 hypothetical protein PtB15_8B287 [Puccinia triticina]
MAPSKKLKNEATDDPELKGRKAAWKPALSTPFAHRWPEIPDEVGHQFLRELLTLLEDRSGPNDSECSGNPLVPPHTAQSEHQASTIEEKCPLGTARRISQSTHMVELRSGKKLAIPDYVPPRRSKFYGKNLGKEPPNPAPLSNKRFSVLSGINSTTKAMEKEIRQTREAVPRSFLASPPTMAQDGHNIPGSEVTKDPCCQPLSFIFVCRKDINPASLVDHLLPTVANLNRSRLHSGYSGADPLAGQRSAILIPLPEGAENLIAGALGLKKAAVVALQGEDARMCSLSQLAGKHIKPVLPPNPNGSPNHADGEPSTVLANESMGLFPTHVKHYKTTVPTDMRKHQAERSERKKQIKAAKRKRNDQDVAPVTTDDAPTKTASKSEIHPPDPVTPAPG